MVVIAVVVFLGVFLVAALLMTASGSGAADEKKQTLERLNALMSGAHVAEEGQLDVRKQEVLSSIPWLNRWLVAVDVAPKLRDLLAQAEVKWTPARLLLTSAVCFVIPAYLVDLRTTSLVAGLLIGVACGGIPFGYVMFRRRKRFDKFEQGLPGALDLMVSGLRSGHSLVSALGLVAREAADPIGREFRICYDEQNYGLELRVAMDNLARRVPIQDVRIVRTAILIQKETGGNLAEVLEKCGQVIRERFRLKREIRTKTAQGRLTGIILSLLPAVLGFLMYLVNPEHMSLLWTRPMGVKMIYAATGMTIVGALIIRKIIRIRV
jgi:tight adherence protein B